MRLLHHKTALVTERPQKFGKKHAPFYYFSSSSVGPDKQASVNTYTAWDARMATGQVANGFAGAAVEPNTAGITCCQGRGPVCPDRVR